jgi:hypothetical protein
MELWALRFIGGGEMGGSTLRLFDASVEKRTNETVRSHLIGREEVWTNGGRLIGSDSNDTALLKCLKLHVGKATNYINF